MNIKKGVRPFMKKRYILIIGGEFSNKGAQAMTCLCINELKQVFPNHEIVLLSDIENKRTPYEKRNYNFLIRSQHIHTKRLFDPFDIWIQKKLKEGHRSNDIIDILENADIMFDISGYALSSQRGLDSSLEFLHRIYVARYYGIKVILMPQSFGPFDYKEPYMDVLLKSLLKYPLLICAREDSGYLSLKKYCNKNLLKTDDMVWDNHKEFILSNIWKKIPDHFISVTTENNILIVPNIRLIQFGDGKTDYISFYTDIINYLMEREFCIYLIAHSKEDINLCKAIKGAFSDNAKVVNIDIELNCWEYEKLVKNMDFIIASRYHAIVHAYKQCVPAIIIGWAEKYMELARIVQQDQYVIDIRNSFTSSQIINVFDKLYQNADHERRNIAQGRCENMKKTRIFEKVFRRIIE